MNARQIPVCNWCNNPSNIIWVHGHGQCSKCGIIIDECCRGEEAQPLSASPLLRRSFNEDEREGEKDKREID